MGPGKLKEKKLVKMHLLLSALFAVCSIPQVIIYLIRENFLDLSDKMSVIIELVLSITDILFYINHSSNFFIFYLTNKVMKESINKYFFKSQMIFQRN